MWSSNISDEALERSLVYYHHLLNAPFYYIAVLASLVALACLACIVKLVMNPLKGMLFDGATLSELCSLLRRVQSISEADPIARPPARRKVLLLSGVSVYGSNFLAALSYLPKGASTGVVHSFKTRDALLTLASSNMIIAVRLSGLLRFGELH